MLPHGRAKVNGVERQKLRRGVRGGSVTSNHNDNLTNRHRFSTLEMNRHR
jgi:hypothetical protein